MPSDTPRTDAENYIRDMGFDKWVSIDFARELERELAAMKDQRDEARREICDLKSTPRWNAYIPIATARRYAEERGWDCFAQEGGGA